MSNARRNAKDAAAAKVAADNAPQVDTSAPKEFPRFRATGGRPIMLASTAGGHTVSVTHEPDGTPLHPRFHRQAVIQGCLPAASFMEVQAEDRALVASAGRDRASILRGHIADMVQVAHEDPSRADELFDGAGSPRTSILSDRAGFPVSTAERDAAWTEYAGDEAGDDGEE